MIELLIQSYWIALLTVFVVGGITVKILVNRFKKENPIPSYWSWLSKNNERRND